MKQSSTIKNTIGILLILLQFSCSTPKDDHLILKVQYQPESKYSISTIRGSETVITYSGEEIAMRKIKSMRLSNPTVSKVKTKTDTELETGKSASNKKVPVNLKYIRTLSLDGENEIPEGTQVQGLIPENHQPVFNSVISEKLNYNQKVKLLETVRSAFEQLDFPEQKLKIGEQFTTTRNTSIPMELSVIEMVVSTTYKLISIKNNQADFELNQSYLMTPKRMDNSFTGSGSGKGQLSYNTQDLLITGYSIKTELVMNKKLDYFEFDLVAKNEFSQTTRLEKQ